MDITAQNEDDFIVVLLRHAVSLRYEDVQFSLSYLRVLCPDILYHPHSDEDMAELYDRIWSMVASKEIIL